MLDAIHQLQRQPPEQWADDDAASDSEEKGRGRIGDGEAIRPDGAHGQAVNQECARIVQQTFAFKNRQEAMGRAHRAEDGGCGDRIWRSHHCTERNSRRPRHRRDDGAGNHGDSDGGESDREYDEPGDRRPVVFQISQRCVVRRVEQNRGDEQREGKFGRKNERWCRRNLLVQAKLLKALEEMRFRRLGEVQDRRVDVRLVAATHRDIDALVQEGSSARTSTTGSRGVEVRVPPLRERGAT